MLDDIDRNQQRMVDAMMQSRPRSKTPAFAQLVKELGNPLMAELMWIYWGSTAVRYIDGELPVLNRHLRWWKFGQEKRTIRKLIKTPEGKAEVWQMLNDAGAWL